MRQGSEILQFIRSNDIFVLNKSQCKLTQNRIAGRTHTHTHTVFSAPRRKGSEDKGTDGGGNVRFPVTADHEKGRGHFYTIQDACNTHVRLKFPTVISNSPWHIKLAHTPTQNVFSPPMGEPKQQAIPTAEPTIRSSMP